MSGGSDPWQALTGLSDRIKQLEAGKPEEVSEDDRVTGRLAERLEVTRIIANDLILAVDWLGGMHNEKKDVWDAASAAGFLAGKILVDMYSVRESEKEGASP